eukprot:486609_1
MIIPITSPHVYIQWNVHGHNTTPCFETRMNLEVQISDTPYYDDCSPQGWKLAQTLDDEYNIGLHGIYGEDELVHYNHEATCLNWYNSTIATKTWYYMGRSSFSFDSDWIQSRKRVD